MQCKKCLALPQQLTQQKNTCHFALGAYRATKILLDVCNGICYYRDELAGTNHFGWVEVQNIVLDILLVSIPLKIEHSTQI